MKNVYLILFILISCSSTTKYHVIKNATFYGKNGLNRNAFNFTTNKNQTKFINHLSLYFDSKPYKKANTYIWPKVSLSNLSDDTLIIKVSLIDNFGSDESYENTFVGIMMSNSSDYDLLTLKDVANESKTFFQKIINISFGEEVKIKNVKKNVRYYSEGEIVKKMDLDNNIKLLHGKRVKYNRNIKDEKILVDLIINKEGKVEHYVFRTKSSETAKKAIIVSLESRRYSIGKYNDKVVKYELSEVFNFD